METKVHERLRLLFGIAGQGKSGVLRYRNGKPPRSFHVDRGLVRMVTGEDPVRFHARWLQSAGLVRAKKLSRALEAQKLEGGDLLGHVVEIGGARPETLREHLRYVTQRELARLLEEPGGSLRFTPGAFDPASLGKGVEEWLLGIPLLDWVLETARARGAEEIFDEVFPSPRDVPVRTGRPCSDTATERGAGVRVLGLVDGVRDLGEILGEASNVSRFDALAILYRLERTGGLRRRSAEELAELGRRFQREGRIDKCHKLFLRARECNRGNGGGEGEIAWELGRAYELMGETDKAVREYSEYARCCREAGRLTEARRGIRRAMELDPGNADVRERVVEILEQLGAGEEVRRETCALIPLLLRAGRFDRAADRIRALLLAGWAERDHCEQLETCWEREGIAVRERLLATLEELEGADRIDAAVLLLEQHLERDGGGDVALRLRFALLLDRAERRSEAVALLETMEADLVEGFPPAEGGDRPGAGELDRVCRALERLVEARPGARMARRWLADHHETSGDRKGASEHLAALARLEGEAGDEEALEGVLTRLAALEPDRMGWRRELGGVLRRRGRDREGNDLLLGVAREWIEGGRADEAREILREILDETPWETRAHRELAALRLREGDPEGAARLRRTAGTIALALGRWEEARSWLEPLVEEGTADTDLLRDLARAQEGLHEQGALLAVLREIAARCRDERNLGLAEQACRRGLEEAPEDPVLAQILGEVTPAAPPVEPAAPRKTARPPEGPTPPVEPGPPAKGTATAGKAPSISGIVEKLRSIKST